MQHGCIIVGASGSLGSQIIPPARDYITIYADKISTNDRISVLDIADQSAIKTFVKNISFTSADRWHICIASGVYDGIQKNILEWEQVEHSLQINLVGPMYFLLRCIARIREENLSARIVLISSMAAGVGSHDVGYGIAKAGLNGAVRSLSKVYAQHGITTIGIAPGIFDSTMSQKQDDSRRNAAIQATHLKRATRVNEVAEVARYALFDASDALTGTIIPVSGGQ